MQPSVLISLHLLLSINPKSLLRRAILCQEDSRQTTINGEQTEFLCEARQSLLEVLRDTLRLTGSKKAATTATAGPAP